MDLHEPEFPTPLPASHLPVLTPRGFGMGHKASGRFPASVMTTRHLFGARRGVGAIMGAVDLSHFVDRIRDQEQTSSCVGQANARIIHVAAQQAKFRGPNPSAMPYPSAQGLYGLAREEDMPDASQPLVDEGSIPGLCVQAYSKDIGVPLERDLPFDPATINARVSPDVLARALAMKVTGCYLIDQDGSDRVDEAARALNEGFAFAMAIQVGDNYENCADDKPIEPETGKIYGGHDIAIVGYKSVNGRRYFLNAGSWDPTQWGFGGFAWIDESVLADERTSDLYVVTAAPDFSNEPAGKDPR